jgi:hypothetical protein
VPQKINQVIDFKTRLLSNLDQRNKQKNAQFLSPVLSSKPSSGSVGNKVSVTLERTTHSARIYMYTRDEFAVETIAMKI